jgi:hypothetical protein
MDIVRRLVRQEIFMQTHPNRKFKSRDKPMMDYPSPAKTFTEGPDDTIFLSKNMNELQLLFAANEKDTILQMKAC